MSEVKNRLCASCLEKVTEALIEVCNNPVEDDGLAVRCVDIIDEVNNKAYRMKIIKEFYIPGQKIIKRNHDLLTEKDSM